MYLRGAEWWDYKPSSRASWYWKKLCQIKEQMKQLYTQTELNAMNKYSIKVVYDKMKGDQVIGVL